MRDAAMHAPLGSELHRHDTRVISRPGWHQIITPSGPQGMLNEVYWSELSEDEIERAIDDVIAQYHSVGQPVKWCVGPWTKPADMGERLTARGFEHWDVWAMGCSTELMAGDGEAVDENNLEEYVRMTRLGWAMGDDQHAPEITAHRSAFAAEPRTAWFFGARHHGELVGSAAIFEREGYGYLVGGVVLDHARGNGVYRQLVGARLAFLKGRGRAFAVTHARGTTSAPMLEHLGFETLFRWKCFRLSP